jgi:hypothetical protein
MLWGYELGSSGPGWGSMFDSCERDNEPLGSLFFLISWLREQL